MDPDATDKADAGLSDREPLRRLRDPDLWIGGDHELGLAMPLGSLDLHLRLRLLRALWGQPQLTGVVCDKQALGDPWIPVNEALAAQKELYGCLRMGKRLVGCYSQFLDNDDEAWFLLCIPRAMVEEVYPVNYVDWEANAWWLAELDAVLAKIGMLVYAQVPFKLGILGFEATADLISRDKLTPQFLARPDLLVPDAQFARFEVAPHGRQMTEGLWWTSDMG